ncbi:MAG: hypothetical protein BWZ03_00462 [bacterium ADurb.BinA186]|nr:MAG: hypothetical protein BWZ03_00462 [bacterium ADurb.BinA186]
MGPKYLYENLTQQIIKLAFEICNEIGKGFPEKIYQKALENKFTSAGLNFKRECYCRLDVEGSKVGHFFLDFLVDGCVVVELKARNEIFKRDISQVLYYMKIKNVKVGLILLFSDNGVKVKRLVL